MKKIVLAAATAAALTVGVSAASAQVFAPWADNYAYGPAYSGHGMAYTNHGHVYPGHAYANPYYSPDQGYYAWRGNFDNETPYADRRGIYGADR